MNISPSRDNNKRDYFKPTEFKCSFDKLNDSVSIRRPHLNIDTNALIVLQQNQKMNEAGRCNTMSSPIQLDLESALPSALIS